MLQTLRRLQKREDGASAVEYVLLVVAIALVMVGAAFALGGSISAKFGDANNCVTSENGEGCPGSSATP